jgi:imidazolonepropionase-like amidohydrolase
MSASRTTKRLTWWGAAGIACAFTGAVIGACANAQTVAITNARLVIGDGTAPVDNGTVVIRNGRVVSAGAGVAVPAGMTSVDARGQYVTPGIVAGFSRVGIVEVDAVDGSNDSSAPNAVFNAAIDISPALNPLGTPVAVNRLSGVTRALVYPGRSSGLFNGRGALVDLGNDVDMLTRAGLFQYVELGEAGARRAGGSRPAAILLFRQMLAEARDYARNPAAYDGRSRDSLLTRADAEALLRVLDGRDRLFIKVERASDILSVIRLLGDFPQIKPTLIGVTEGWQVAPQIAAAGIPVIASALNDLPDTFEQLGATQSNIGRMRAAGVSVAIGLVDDNETHKLGYARQYAGNLVALTRMPGASGLNWDQAFASITSGPAVAAGVDGDVGSLRPGRVGDVVIWDGDPLELSSAPVAIYVDGVEQPMTSRQLELRNRYMSPVEGELPNAYDR